MGHKVLLADDSITVQKIVKLSLTEEGIEVIALGNGEQAVQQLETLQPDLVMADVFMPGKDGYEVCEFVKSHPQFKHLPVILLVHAFEPFDPERAKKVGADQQLTKPFQSIRTLVNTVRELLSKPAAAMDGLAAPVQTTPPPPAPEPLAPPPMLAVTPPAEEEFAVVSSLTPPPGIALNDSPFNSLPLPDTNVATAPPALDVLPPFPFAEAGFSLHTPDTGFANESAATEPPPPLELGMLPSDNWSSAPAAGAVVAAPEAMPSFAAFSLNSVESETGEVVDDVLDLPEMLSVPSEHGRLAPSASFASANDIPLLSVLPPVAAAPTNEAVTENVAEASFATAFDLGMGQCNPDTPTFADEVFSPPAETFLPVVSAPPVAAAPTAAMHTASPLSEAVIEEIVNRVVQRLSAQAIQEIAWEVVPEMAELLIRKQLSSHPQLSH